MIVFPFKPNWAAPVNQIFEFQTEVMRHDDASEQRRIQRLRPRLSYEYDLWQKGRDADRLDLFLRSKNNQDILLPEWIHATRATAPITGGSSTIALDTIDRSFRAGEYLVIYSNTTTYEYVQIDEVQVDEITTVDPIASSWPQGTKIYPGVVGRFPFTVQTRRHTSNVVYGKAIFKVNPGSFVPYLPEIAAPITHEGLEVVTAIPNWRAPISNDYMRELRLADSGVGVVKYFTKDDFSQVTRPFEWLLKSKNAIRGFQGFLARRIGQAKTCWVPSWHRDFTVVSNSGPSVAALTVQGNEVLALLGNDVSQTRLRIRLNDGTVFYKTIVSLVADGPNTTITLSSSFGLTVGPANINAVDWLLKCRMASDKVEIPWITSKVANPTTTFTTVIA